MYTLRITIHSQPPHLNIGHLLLKVFFDVFHEIFSKYKKGNQYRVTTTRALTMQLALQGELGLLISFEVRKPDPFHAFCFTD
jgi:hypothetical protein